MILWDAHTHFPKDDGHSIYNAEQNGNGGRYHSVGIHPWKARNSFDQKKLKDSLSDNLCVALGEIGLDKLRGPDLYIQMDCLVKQLEINETFQLPVILHNVRATNELIALKKNFPQQTWVIHDFQKIRTFEALQKEGIEISIGQALLHRKDLQDFVNQLPLDRLLLESDEHPELLQEVYQKVCEVKNLSLLTLRDHIGENFKQIFKRWQTGWNEQN